MSVRCWFRSCLPALTAIVCLTSVAASGQQPLKALEAPPRAESSAAVHLADAPPASPIAAEPAGAAAATAPAPAGQTPEAPAALPAALEPAPPQEADEVVELIKERYPNGAIKIEREMVQDAAGNYVLHGAWRAYDEAGRLIIDGRYDHGHREGLWRRSYRGDETPLLSTAPYKEFTPPFTSSATFHESRLQGKWMMIDAKQRKIHELELTTGERHGPAIWYHPSGCAMLQARYEDGLISGDVLHLASDGKLIAKEAYQSGRKLAPKTTYHDANQKHTKQQVTYLHALVVAKSLDNWDTGTLATFESRGEDERHGPFATWHANGQPAKQGEFRYNEPVGKFTAWYSNGQKQFEGTYADGRQEGVWTWWHENGQKSITGEYHDGVAVGGWSWWDAGGKLARRADLPAGIQGATSGLRQAKLKPAVEPGLPLR